MSENTTNERVIRSRMIHKGAPSTSGDPIVEKKKELAPAPSSSLPSSPTRRSPSEIFCLPCTIIFLFIFITLFVIAIGYIMSLFPAGRKPQRGF